MLCQYSSFTADRESGQLPFAIGKARLTLYAPWYSPTSSPRMKTLSSLLSSSSKAEFSASRTVNCRSSG